jgi:hypothetical protein
MSEAQHNELNIPAGSEFGVREDNQGLGGPGRPIEPKFTNFEIAEYTYDGGELEVEELARMRRLFSIANI